MPSAAGDQGDLQMVECERYREGRAGDAGAQPWRLELASAAALVMDFHAHLCTDEIIGFLGGTYDANARILRVARALPARRLHLGGTGRNASVEVELDPECVPEIVDALDADGLRVVGWYHSHPVFVTHPSLRDVENQANYQGLFEGASIRDGDGVGAGAAPFVGGIVGPYNDENADATSDVRWFHVVDGGSGDARPFELECVGAGCSTVSPNVLADMRELADHFAGKKKSKTGKGGDGVSDGVSGVSGDAGKPASPGTPVVAADESVDRVNLSRVWRDGLSRADKLEKSLASRLPESWSRAARDGYVKGVVRYLKDAWGVGRDETVNAETEATEAIPE